jgi:DNA-binding MarR family transcriptional regulator
MIDVNEDDDMTPANRDRARPAPDYVAGVLASWAAERPDLAVEPVAIVYRLLRLAARLAPEVEKPFASSGITAADFYVLASLRRVGPPYRASQRELIDALGLTSGTVSVRVSRMATLGLVEREADPNDGRGVRVTLTPKGERLFDDLAPRHLSNEARLVSALDPNEQAELARLLNILLAEYEPLESAPGDALGLALAPSHVNHARRQALGLPPVDGLLVEHVRPGSPAAAAGIEAGDVVVGAGKRPLRSLTCLLRAISEAGEQLQLQVLRGDRIVPVRIGG